MSSVTDLANSYTQSLLSIAGTSNPTATGSATLLTELPQDQSQLSPLTTVLSSLQQLQQTNPTEYEQVTQTISTNLQNAASSATEGGNTALASELTQLSTDFKNASSTGQLPNIQDLAQALGGGDHPHGDYQSAESTNPFQIIESALSSLANPIAGGQTA